MENRACFLFYWALLLFFCCGMNTTHKYPVSFSLLLVADAATPPTPPLFPSWQQQQPQQPQPQQPQQQQQQQQHDRPILWHRQLLEKNLRDQEAAAKLVRKQRNRQISFSGDDDDINKEQQWILYGAMALLQFESGILATHVYKTMIVKLMQAVRLFRQKSITTLVILGPLSLLASYHFGFTMYGLIHPFAQPLVVTRRPVSLAFMFVTCCLLVAFILSKWSPTALWIVPSLMTTIAIGIQNAMIQSHYSSGGSIIISSNGVVSSNIGIILGQALRGSHGSKAQQKALQMQIVNGLAFDFGVALYVAMFMLRGKCKDMVLGICSTNTINYDWVLVWSATVPTFLGIMVLKFQQQGKQHEYESKAKAMSAWY